MRIANLGGRPAVITGAGAVDLGDRHDFDTLYERWDDTLAAAAAADPAAAVPFDDAHLGPPSPAPRQVFGIGLNYRAHAEESGQAVPPIPATFTKFPTCLTGPFAQVALPSASVDWEVELVVVIGRHAARVAEADAWAHVAGVTIGQDLSERIVQFTAGAQFSLGKSYPGFGPTGPWLVTPDELDDPDDLALGCAVDGETVQDARTSDMAFSVPQLIAQLSAVVPLLPGDVIFTGTPAGVGFTRNPARALAPGQTLESWIDGIGRMTTRFVAAGA